MLPIGQYFSVTATARGLWILMRMPCILPLALPYLSSSNLDLIWPDVCTQTGTNYINVIW
jgi:hypothetical protein